MLVGILDKSGTVVNQVNLKGEFPPAVLMIAGVPYTQADAFGQSFGPADFQAVQPGDLLPPPGPEANVARTVGDMRRIVGTADSEVDVWLQSVGQSLAFSPGSNPPLFSVYNTFADIPSGQTEIQTTREILDALASYAPATLITVLATNDPYKGGKSPSIPSVLVASAELGGDFAFDVVPA